MECFLKQHHLFSPFLNDMMIRAKMIVICIQFDEIPSLKGLGDPILSLCRWFASNILSGFFNEWAHKNMPVFLFFDEVQNSKGKTAELDASYAKLYLQDI